MIKSSLKSTFLLLCSSLGPRLELGPGLLRAEPQQIYRVRFTDLHAQRWRNAAPLRGIIWSISTVKSNDGPSVLSCLIPYRYSDSLVCVVPYMNVSADLRFIFSFIAFKYPCAAVTANSISVGQIKEYLLSKRYTNGQFWSPVGLKLQKYVQFIYILIKVAFGDNTEVIKHRIK